jgi:hypothetical protein
MNKVQKPSDSECYTPSSVSFRFTWSWVCLRYYLEFVRSRKYMNNLPQENQRPGRNSIQAPPEYKSAALASESNYSVGCMLFIIYTMWRRVSFVSVLLASIREVLCCSRARSHDAKRRDASCYNVHPVRNCLIFTKPNMTQSVQLRLAASTHYQTTPP